MTLHQEPADWLTFKHYSEVPMYNTKAVVQQTGVPAPTLRAWERRYTLLSPERATNDYRLYSERDIFMIRWLKERVDEGMAISQAIALFRHIYEEQQQFQDEYVSSLTEEHAEKPAAEQEPAFEIATDSPEHPVHTKKTQPFHDWPTLEQTSAQSSYPSIHNMRIVRERLLEAFNALDEAVASTLMASMLAIYPVEQICTDLITPTMWQVGQLWADGKLTVPIEHFASNFFRALLTNLFYITPRPTTGPLVLSCSAAGEPHELAVLMLSLFMRRSGIRVAYLGQSIETAGLLQVLTRLKPALVCISLTLPAYLPALIDLATQIHQLPPPRPLFAFGGQVFTHQPTAIAQIPGIYLNGDLRESVDQLKTLLAENARRN